MSDPLDQIVVSQKATFFLKNKYENKLSSSFKYQNSYTKTRRNRVTSVYHQQSVA